MAKLKTVETQKTQKPKIHWRHKNPGRPVMAGRKCSKKPIKQPFFVEILTVKKTGGSQIK